MTKSDNVTSYLRKITQICNQLAAVSEKAIDAKIVHVTLNGFPKSREPFVKGLCAQENIPKWKRLWDDCIQKEPREKSKANQQGGSDETLALVSKTRKGKGRGFKKVTLKGSLTSRERRMT